MFSLQSLAARVGGKRDTDHFWYARTAQINAVSVPVATENQRRRVTKVSVMTLTIKAFRTLVENAGLSLPKIVGTIDGKNASWQIAITVSCHIDDKYILKYTKIIDPGQSTRDRWKPHTSI